jgi:hypothetical protein
MGVGDAQGKIAPGLRGQHRADATAGIRLGVSERALQGDAERCLPQLTGRPAAPVAGDVVAVVAGRAASW